MTIKAQGKREPDTSFTLSRYHAPELVAATNISHYQDGSDAPQQRRRSSASAVVQRHLRRPPPQTDDDAHDILLEQKRLGPFPWLAWDERGYVRAVPALRFRLGRFRRVVLPLQTDQAGRKPGRGRVLPDRHARGPVRAVVHGDAGRHVVQRRRIPGGDFGPCGRVLAFREPGF
ncbi:hypothetical protein U1Q18_008503 [Sarracenia purpurea var. burkii]